MFSNYWKSMTGQQKILAAVGLGLATAGILTQINTEKVDEDIKALPTKPKKTLMEKIIDAKIRANESGRTQVIKHNDETIKIPKPYKLEKFL
jgi:hypothetical protein